MKLSRSRSRAIACALSVCAAFLIASPTNAKTATDPLFVGILAVNYNSPSIYEMGQIALADCKQRSWKCEVFDGKGDMVATNNAGVNFVNRKVDAILNIASDNNEMGQTIRTADSAKVPFVSTFSGDVPGIVADIGTNGVIEGALSAAQLKSMLNNKGHVIKFNWTVLPVLRDRGLGFDAIMSTDKNIKVTSVQVKVPGQVEDTFNQLTNILASNKDVNGVWVGWDELATPAVRAIERAGMTGKIKVVGMDGIEPVLDMLRKPDSPYVLTVAYSHKEAIDRAMNVIAEAVDGKKILFREQTIRDCLVTKANVPPAGQHIDFKTCTPFSAEIDSK